MKDPDESEIDEAKRRADPRRVGDALERIEWLWEYGQYGFPLDLRLIGWSIVALLALILWRVW